MPFTIQNILTLSVAKLLSVGLFLLPTISILETVGFILSISIVEELRPHWLSLPLSWVDHLDHPLKIR